MSINNIYPPTQHLSNKSAPDQPKSNLPDGWHTAYYDRINHPRDVLEQAITETRQQLELLYTEDNARHTLMENLSTQLNVLTAAHDAMHSNASTHTQLNANLPGR